MNDELNQENLQETVDSNMTPEEAKAALGLATRLSEQMLASQSQTNNPPEEVGLEADQPELEPEREPEIDIETVKAEITESIKNDIKSIVKEEMSGLRKEIQDALKED